MTNSFAWTILLVLVSLLSCPGYTGSSRELSNSKQQPIGTVLCEDGLASCPVHSSTCCLGKSNRYFCCPLPNAVCCADGIHCCPQCFSCNIKGNSCLRPATDAAAVRIYSLVPHSDKRIHTPPPVPPAAAAVAAAIKQREIAENKAAALAAAIARKKAAEESQGFVSGVLSAVKLTLFSSSDESAARKSSQTKVSPSLAGHGIKSQQSASISRRVPVSSSLKPPLLKPPIAQATYRPQAAGISKSSGILAHAATTSAPGGKPPVKSTSPTGHTVQKQQGSTGIKQGVAGAGQKHPAKSPVLVKSAAQGKEEAKEQQNTGFFSSVFSAVTDFYSGGSKTEDKSTDTNKPKLTTTKEQQLKLQQLQLKQQQQQQQQQLLKQQQQKVGLKQPGKIAGQIVGKIPGTPSGQISKQISQQTKPPAQKPPIKTSVSTPKGQQLNNKASQEKVVSMQANAKQSTVQGKAGTQAGLKPVSPGQPLKAKQSVGIPQKSAAAAIKAQEMKAKAWESKPSKKL